MNEKKGAKPLSYNLYSNIIREKGFYKINIAEDIKATELVVDDFFWLCDSVDVSCMSDEVLLIPLILNMAPVIWANGINVKIETMDKTLLKSLNIIRSNLKVMYPSLSWNGIITPQQTINISSNAKKSTVKNENPLVLFSGGVDSVFTLMSHLKEKPTLVTVRGIDISFGDIIGWKLVQEQTRQFALDYGLNYTFVESNFYSFLNQSKLNLLTNEIPNWWGYVQHGMGFSGLAAPIAFDKAINKLYFASSHTSKFQQPWGSDPKIDDNIKWKDFHVVHDGYDYSRHSKLQSIIKDHQQFEINSPYLRVCYSNRENGGKNCCFCEKCARTISALYIEGREPASFGFDINQHQFIHTTYQSFKNLKFDFKYSTQFFWEDIQASIRETDCYMHKGYSKELIYYIKWLKKFDFNSYRIKCAKRKRSRQKLKLLVEKLPFVYYCYNKAKKVKYGNINI